MTIAVFTAQIGYYHDARYRAALADGMDFIVLVTQNGADFAEFMAKPDGSYLVKWLFESREDYVRAVRSSAVWSTVSHALNQLDPEIVVIDGWSTPENFAAVAWARARQRRIVMLSESQEKDASRSSWREWIKARVVELCDTALVGGRAHADYVERLGISRDKVFLGYNAVDNDHFGSGAIAARADEKVVRERLGMPERYVLASGRFISKKNFRRLVAAYAEATRGKRDQPELVILGDGPERSTIEQTIRDLHPDFPVHLPGFRGYLDLPALYGLSEGFLHVSTSEQWGLVINEAAAAAVPIVASSACGATETLIDDGTTGFVVDARDVASIANGLERLFELSPAERHQIGNAAARRVAAWGPDRYANGLKAACCASDRTHLRKLKAVDSALLRILARMSISDVQ